MKTLKHLLIVVTILFMVAVVAFIIYGWYDLLVNDSMAPWLGLLHTRPHIGVPLLISHNVFLLISFIYVLNHLFGTRKHQHWHWLGRSILIVLIFQLVNIVAVIAYISAVQGN